MLIAVGVRASHPFGGVQYEVREVDIAIAVQVRIEDGMAFVPALGLGGNEYGREGIVRPSRALFSEKPTSP